MLPLALGGLLCPWISPGCGLMALNWPWWLGLLPAYCGEFPGCPWGLIMGGL